MLVHARERERARARVCALLASAQVQYPWMSVDLVTHIIVKRGLNSNPSRAAGRALSDVYPTLLRISLFLRKSPLFLFFFSGPIPAEISSSSSKETQTSSTEPESRVMCPSGMALAASLRSRGILGEGALYRRSLSLFSPQPRSVSLSSSRGTGSLPLFPFLARRQAVTVREALTEGAREGTLFPKASGDHNKERCDFRSEEKRRAKRRAERRFWTAA